MPDLQTLTVLTSAAGGGATTLAAGRVIRWYRTAATATAALDDDTIKGLVGDIAMLREQRSEDRVAYAEQLRLLREDHATEIRGLRADLAGAYGELRECHQMHAELRNWRADTIVMHTELAALRLQVTTISPTGTPVPELDHLPPDAPTATLTGVPGDRPPSPDGALATRS